MNLHATTFRALVATGAAALLAGCADAVGAGKSDRVSLSFASSATAARSTSAAGADVSLRVVSGNGHVLDLQHADLTLGDVRLDRRDGRDEADSDSDSRHGDDAVFRSGPVTVELPLDGGVVTPLDGGIPFGTYDELEADVEYLRLRGTYDGQPFDVTLAIDRKLETELRPPLVVDADHLGENVTVRVDVEHCFRDAAGAPVDPRRLSSDSALRAQVRECIARDLRAFEDRDHDADDEDSDSDR